MELVEDIALKLDCPSDIAKTIHSYIDKSEILADENGLAQVVVYFGIKEMLTLIAGFVFIICSDCFIT